ncbi:hypothetical protein GN156_07990 [bacterium LRH843]|nr:hypothetical protein [bacterium LRH843]
MKRIGVASIVFIILSSIYYDLTIGTLPDIQASFDKTEQQTVLSIDETPTNANMTSTIPSQAIIVEPGYTVLSIVERLHEGPIPASIQEIVYDFKQLNGGTEPEKMIVGNSYLFPLYQ